MGIRSNGKHAFGVVLPDGSVEVVESVGWVHGFGEDGEPELTLWDEQNQAVATFREWREVISELEGDVPPEEPS